MRDAFREPGRREERTGRGAKKPDQKPAIPVDGQSRLGERQRTTREAAEHRVVPEPGTLTCLAVEEGAGVDDAVENREHLEAGVLAHGKIPRMLFSSSPTRK